MKKFINLLPAALGILFLGSCSNEDFGDARSVADLNGKYVLTVTNEDDGNMRAFKDAAYVTTFMKGDTMRIYDSNLKIYDEFAFDNGYFTISADKAKITEKNSEGNLDYAYALFGSDGKNISYAGWNNGDIALIKINSEIEYEETDGGLYKSTLPMWGTVESVVSEVPTGAAKSFNASLRYLTARAKVTFKNGDGLGDLGKKRVRATSLKFATGKKLSDLQNALKNKKIGDKVDYSTVLVSEGAKPLAGWFEAVLDKEKKEDGIREITDKNGPVTAASETQIVVNVGAKTMQQYDNVVFIPIVPGTYDAIMFEYSITDDDDNWQYIGCVTDPVGRGDKIGEDWEINTALETNLILEDGLTSEITAELAKLNNEYEGIDIELNVLQSITELKTKEETNLHTIYIPQLKNNFTVNIKSTTGVELSSYGLVIADGTGVDNSAGEYNIGFNFELFKGDGTTSNVQLKAPTTDVVLSGKFNNARLQNVTVVAETKSLTLSDFTASDRTVEVVKGDITVENEAGTAKIKKITNKAANNKVVITSGTVAEVDMQKGSSLEVEEGVITTLTLGDSDMTIEMAGGAIDNIAKGAAKMTADRAITVNTAGAAVITSGPSLNSNKTAVELAGTDKKYTFTFTSTYNENTVAAETAQKNVYTAAQLVALVDLTEATVDLLTDIVVDVNPGEDSDTEKFESITLNSTITTVNGNGHTVSGLTAPLFTNLAASVSKLNITSSTITPDADTENSGVGALADAVSASSKVTIENVVVSGVTIGLDGGPVKKTSANYGLLVGKTSGEVEIKDCGVNGTVKGNYNLGGYVGQMVDGTLSITKTKDNLAKNMSNVTIQKTYVTNEDVEENAGKIGHFVGSITDGTITIGDKDNAKAFSNFFSAADSDAADWTAKVATKTGANNKTLTYQGMKPNYEIGLSTAVTSVSLYGTTKVKVVGSDGKETEVDRNLTNTINIYE